MPNTCTVAGLQTPRPFTKALSKSQMEDLLILLYADAAGVTFDVPTIVALGKCFACMTKSQTLAAEATIMLGIYETGATFPALMAKIKCLECLPPNIKRGMLTSLKCTYWNSRA